MKLTAIKFNLILIYDNRKEFDNNKNISDIMKACRNCHMIVEEHDLCPNCNSELSKEWQGYVVILDYSRSEIAKKMNIQMNGKFALKVK